MEIYKARLQVRVKRNGKTLSLDRCINYIVGLINSPFDWKRFNMLRGPVFHAVSEKEVESMHSSLCFYVKEFLYCGKQKELNRRLKRYCGNLGDKSVHGLLVI